MTLAPLEAAILDAKIALCQLRARHPQNCARILRSLIAQLERMRKPRDADHSATPSSPAIAGE